MDFTTYFYRHADGSVSAHTITGPTAPAAPDGATPVSQAEYETELAMVQARRREHAAQLLADDERRTGEDYAALRQAGIPEATARRLSGYTGPAADPGQP